MIACDAPTRSENLRCLAYVSLRVNNGQSRRLDIHDGGGTNSPWPRVRSLASLFASSSWRLLRCFLAFWEISSCTSKSHSELVPSRMRTAAARRARHLKSCFSLAAACALPNTRCTLSAQTMLGASIGCSEENGMYDCTTRTVRTSRKWPFWEQVRLCLGLPSAPITPAHRLLLLLPIGSTGGLPSSSTPSPPVNYLHHSWVSRKQGPASSTSDGGDVGIDRRPRRLIGGLGDPRRT